jgi:hypothetical protein
VSPFLGYRNRYQCLRSTCYFNFRGRRTSSSMMLKVLRSSEMGCSLSNYTASHLSTDCNENLKSRMPFSWFLHSASTALEHVSHGLNPTRGMYMYVYVSPCVARRLATGRIPCPEESWSKCIKDVQNPPFLTPSPQKTGRFERQNKHHWMALNRNMHPDKNCSCAGNTYTFTPLPPHSVPQVMGWRNSVGT